MGGYPPLLSAGYVGAVSLQIVDYPDDIELDTVAVDVNGNAIAMTDAVPLGYIWRIERMTTFVTNTAGALLTPPAGAVFNVYKVPAGVNTGLPRWFRDGSQSPGLDVADESSPITVQQGLSLLFAWSGHTAGTFCHATAQYALYRKFVGGA